MKQYSPSPFRLALYAVYILLFLVYPLLQPDRSSTALFLWMSSVHSVLGLAIAFTERESGWNARIVWLLFLLPRCITFPMYPWLSDDVFRYLWDGTLTTHGFNCYAHLPNAPELAFLRDDLYHRMDYKNISTLYPPLAQLVFASAVWVGHLFTTSWFGPYIVWKIILLIGEAAGLHFLMKTVHLLKQPLHRVGFYLFLTLPVIELSGQAHMDGLLVLPVGFLLYCCAQAFTGEKSTDMALNTAFSWKAGSVAGVLFLLKLMPAAIALPLLRTRISYVHFLGAAVLTILIPSLPFFLHPLALPSFLGVIRFYSNVAQFNGIPLYLLNTVFQYLPLQHWWLITPSLLSGLRVIVTLWIGFRRQAKTLPDLYKLMFFALFAVILLSAKVHIWYFIPLLFLNVLVEYRWFMITAQAAMLTYAIYAGAQVQEAYSVEYILWAAGLALACGEYVWRKQSDRTVVY